MRDTTKIVIGLGTVIGVGFMTSEALILHKQPPYSVVTKQGSCELRTYPALVAAGVEVGGSRMSGANRAFKILAGYIFGKNSASKQIEFSDPTVSTVSEKIAMISPVTSETSGTSTKMSFFMPSKYTLESLPKPNDKRIQFHAIEPKQFAVVRFFGVANEKLIQQYTEKLRSYLRAAGLSPNAEPIFAFYNQRWTLPIMRRNEIWIEVA